MNIHRPALRTLNRALSHPTSLQQVPPLAFCCASLYFLPIPPTRPLTLPRYRCLSSTPSTPPKQQLTPPKQQLTPPKEQPTPPKQQLTPPKQQLTPQPTAPPPPPPPASLPPQQPNQNLTSLLPLLRLQPSHYITIHINSFPFLVTPGDKLTLPFLLPDVSVGDILRLTHASILGSRDYTIKGSPYVDQNLFELRARVVEVTSEPMRIKIKKKQRTRRTKTVKSKHKYTVLRIGELVVKDAPAPAAGAEVQVGAEVEAGMTVGSGP